MSVSELCANIITRKQDNSDLLDKNIIEFATATWGLGLGCTPEVPALYPAQRFLLKAYYGLELDNSAERDIIVRDKWNESELYRFNEREYMNFLFHEGRINKIYEIGTCSPNMVLVCGRRSGKCIVGDSLVVTDKGILRIDELGSAPCESFSESNITVVQEKAKTAKAAAFYNGGVKPTFVIKTVSGYTITGTANHRIKVMASSGNVEWRYLDDIRPEDYVAINRKTDLWPSKEIDLRPYHNSEGRKEFKLPTTLNECVGNLLGYLVGDGSWSDKTGLFVTVEHSETWSHLKDLFGKILGDTCTVKDKRTKNTGRIGFCSTKARIFFDAIGWKFGCAFDEKMIPWSIMRSPKRVVCAFLRGLFETDGCAEKGGSYITFSSASFRLAHEVQILLLNMGIVSSVRKKWVKRTKRHYANLSIKGVQSRKLFSELIGFDSEKKREPMVLALKNATEGKSNTDSIPHQRNKVRDWLFSIPVHTKKEGAARNILREASGNVHKNSNENITYTKLVKCLAVAERVGAGEKETTHFKEILDLDYFYDAIASVDNSEDQVYDLTVPDGENFVANGITNHNTTVTSCIISYETYKLLNKYCPQEYYGIMPEQDIRITCVSTSKDSASELFNMVTGHMERSEFFRKYRNKPTAQWVYLRTQRDIDKYGPRGRTSLSVRVAPCSAKGLRGSNNMIVALDEMAFFFADDKDRGDSNKDKNDRAIYKAVTPSVAKFKRPDGTPDGKVICISSPGPKSGKFFEEYERSFASDNELFMVQAPTWEIDPSIATQYLKNKFKENPISYRSEFGAQFSDRMFGYIEDASLVRQNIVSGLKYKDRSMLRVPHFMGVDVGLKNDGSAVTIGHWVSEIVDGIKVDKIEVDLSMVRYASDEGKEYFNPDEITEWIISFTNKFYIAKGLMDQYYGMTICPALNEKGHKQFEYRQFTDQLNSSVYQVLLTDFISSAIRLPEGELRTVEGEPNKDSDLVKELLTLQAEQKSKYLIRVSAPERKGEHDDLSDSLARMVFLAHEHKSKSYSTSTMSVTAAVGMIKAARMIRRSELAKASLNRPSTRMMGRMRNRTYMPMSPSTFR